MFPPSADANLFKDAFIKAQKENEALFDASGEGSAPEEEKKVGANSALPKITTAGYASLDLIRYFTCGPDEVRAWTIRRGTKAPQAAGVIQ